MKINKISDTIDVTRKLYIFWDNRELFTFLYGDNWVRKRELEIASKLVDGEVWIEICRANYDKDVHI